MRRVLVDANVFIYALGAEHPYREPCRLLVAALAEQRIAGETSVEIVQEFVHVRRRRGDSGDATQRAREILAWDLPLHDFDVDDLERALQLLDRYESLPGRDAVHAATALNRGIDCILSTDAHFDLIHDLTRIDPGDPAALEGIKRPGG